jgi:hypothetical protein
MGLVTGREGKQNEDELSDLRRKRKHVEWKKETTERGIKEKNRKKTKDRKTKRDIIKTMRNNDRRRKSKMKMG